jgi:phage repressor protein C with HTH and peptisase S24 domain
MPTDEQDDDAKRRALGQALKRLRTAAGMSQAEAAEAYGCSPQAWQRYEVGQRKMDLEKLDAMARAVGASRDELLVERGRLLGEEPKPAARSNVTQLPVWGRGRAGPHSDYVYDLVEPESHFDVSWMGGQGVGVLRVAGDSMTGYVESGQLVIYDRGRWPRRGEGCVVETTGGELYVKLYDKSDGSTLFVRQLFPERAMTFAMSDVRGVYAIRLRGD